MTEPTPETRIKQLEERLSDTLGRMVSLERQMLEKQQDLHFLEEEMKKMQSFTTPSDPAGLSEGDQIAADILNKHFGTTEKIKFTEVNNPEPYQQLWFPNGEPMFTDDAGRDYNVKDLVRAHQEMEKDKDIHQCQFATVQPYDVTCLACRETIAFCDGQLQGQQVGIHDCDMDK